MASIPAIFAVAASVIPAAPPLYAGPLTVESAEVFAAALTESGALSGRASGALGLEFASFRDGFLLS
jgi:hypothetical protein